MAGVGLAAMAAAAIGCTESRRAAGPDDRCARAAALAEGLRLEAGKVADADLRDRLQAGLTRIVEVLRGGPEVGAAPAAQSEGMFAPASIAIGFFTRSKDFDGQPGDDGLEVRVQPLDRFGDPTKATGSYRVEVFESRRLTTEKRGRQLGQWFIQVLDEAATRKYYDPLDRSYVFPLLWETPLEPGMEVIVQVTYGAPGEAVGRLAAQRAIRIGGG
jgi:hypothetical protein